MTLHKNTDKELSELSASKGSQMVNLNIPAGYYASWICTAQLRFYTLVEMLDDDGVVYFSTTNDPMFQGRLSIGDSTIKGNNLRFSIQVDRKLSLRSQKNFVELTDDKGDAIGKITTIAFSVSADQGNNKLSNSNNVYFNIVAWKKSD